MVRSSIISPGNSDQPQGGFRPPDRILRPGAVNCWTKSHIVQNTRHEQLIIGVLKNDADFPAYRSSSFGRERKPPDNDFALTLENSVQMMNECRFAGAVCSQQNYCFALLQPKIYTLQGGRTIGVSEVQIRNRN
jgi:hypothetical protein